MCVDILKNTFMGKTRLSITGYNVFKKNFYSSSDCRTELKDSYCSLYRNKQLLFVLSTVQYK